MRRPAAAERSRKAGEEARERTRTQTRDRGRDGPTGRRDAAGLDSWVWTDWDLGGKGAQEWFEVRGRCQRSMDARRTGEEGVGSP